MAFQKKATASTEVVLGAAAAAIKKSVSELESGVLALKALENTLDEQQLKIAQKEDQINALDIEFAEKKRQSQVQLELDTKKGVQTVVEVYLNAEGLVAVDENESKELENELTELKAKFDEKVKEETGRVAGRYAADARNERALLESQYNAREAENKAKITQLEQQVTFLHSQVALWKTELSDERKASVDRAKAGSIGTLNVGQPSGNGR